MVEGVVIYQVQFNCHRVAIGIIDIRAYPVHVGGDFYLVLSLKRIVVEDQQSSNDKAPYNRRVKKVEKFRKAFFLFTIG